MTYLLSPDEVAAAYVELRTRVTALLREAGEGVADIPVPHCPAWTVKMVASHLLGLPEDSLGGIKPGDDLDAWTQAQVDRHRDDSLMSILDAWEAMGPTIDPIFVQQLEKSVLVNRRLYVSLPVLFATRCRCYLSQKRKNYYG